MGAYIVLGIILGILLLGGIVFLTIRSKVREISREVYGTDNIMEGLRAQEVAYMETPKTVMGMTSILLPQIHKDFPEFNWPEWRQRCEEQLKEYLHCLETNSVVGMKSASDSLIEEIRQEVVDRSTSGVHEKFDSIVVHKTEITDYVKKNGQCVIKTLTGLEYRHSLKGDRPIDSVKEQHRFVTELYYIQNLDAVQTTENGLGIVCPNCGAPVHDLGVKRCAYCGCAIVGLNLHMWKIGKIQKRD